MQKILRSIAVSFGDLLLHEKQKKFFCFAFVLLNNEINEASLKPPVDVAETTIMNTKLTRLTTGTCTLLAQAFNVRRCKPG